MGMAASQARYLALTERMNDIEYQGQQINQQRTTLSSQINALYNSLLDMEVPTPPSTTDYTKVVYSGIQNASKFELDNIVPTGKNNVGKDTFSIDFKYEMAGHAVSKNINTATLTNTSQYLTYKPVADDNSIKNVIESKVTLYKPGTAIRTDADLPNSTNSNENNVLIAVKASDIVNNPAMNQFSIFDSTGHHLNEIPNDDSTVYIQCNTEDFSAATIESYITKNSANEYTNVYNCVTEEKSELHKMTDANVADLGLYYVSNPNDNSCVPKLITTFSELESIYNESKYNNIVKRDYSGDGVEYTNPNYKSSNSTGWTVGDMPVLEMADAQLQLISSYDDYITALKHSFPEYAKMTDDEVASKFYVYIERTQSGTNVPHFIKKDEISAFSYNDATSIRSYEYDQSGTYTNIENKKNCELEFDVNTGRITRVGVPDGNGQVLWIEIKSETTTDNKAYDEAFNKYEYQKLLYDKKQQEINAKTSIIQSQDKSLELKLTRLDNERNAVNTELEAVKKVVEDNIQKSFKTFSG